MEAIFTRLPIAMTDIETTGLSPLTHEIIEIGCVLLDQQTGEFLDEFEVRIRPEHISRAAPQALQVNGYREELWEDAVSLHEGVELYVKKINRSVFCAQNATFDWSFLSCAFERTQIQPNIDYHRLDLMSLAYAQLREKGVTKYNLNALATFFNLEPESFPHRALTGARIASRVYRCLMQNK